MPAIYMTEEEIAKRYSILGKPIPRVETKYKATGQAKYAADFEEEGMLWSQQKRSPYPHAKILNIDTSKAEKLPGVKGIITGKDFNGFRWGWSKPTRDEEPLAVSKVRYQYEAVAAVAAVDEDTAQEACDLIEVDWEPLPGVFDPFEAMAEGAPLVHENRPGNICVEYHWNFGNVDEAFDKSYLVMKDTFRTPRMAKGYIEPPAAMAWWPDENHVVYRGAKGSPYFPYRIISNCFNLPLSNVRVITPIIGSDFGGTKNDMVALDFSTVMLSKKTGRPVKQVYTQFDELTTCLRRHPMWVTIKTGVTKEGVITAIHIDLVSDGGAYTRMSPLTHYLAGSCACLPYHVPHFKYDARCFFTNNPSSAAMRGHGVYHTRFAADVQMDMIAEKLEIDPVEIRRRNLIKNPEPGKPYETINKTAVATCGIEECLEKTVEAVNWDKRKKQEIKVVDSKAYGMGFACATYNGGTQLSAHNACAGLVRICEDGSVNYITGATDVGMGSDTIGCAIVAEVLGLKMSDLDIKRVDTLYSPVDPGSYGSRVTVLAGEAAQNAALDAKKQLLDFAAKQFGVSPDELELKNRMVFVKSDPSRNLSWEKLIRHACYDNPGRVIIGKGQSTRSMTPDLLANFSAGTGSIGVNFSFTAHALEAEVDVETGVVKCTDNNVCAHDCGFPLNPPAVETQVIGGAYHQGIGAALYEEFKMDKGQTLNPNLIDYKRPHAYEAPDMKVLHVITDDPYGPYGAKEASECSCCTAPPALVNAIHNATGIWVKDLPTQPEKVFWLLKEKREKKDKK